VVVHGGRGFHGHVLQFMNFSIVILEVLWDITMEEYGTDDVQGETNAAHDQDQHRILNSCMLH
jgi:hypothetical protein